MFLVAQGNFDGRRTLGTLSKNFAKRSFTGNFLLIVIQMTNRRMDGPSIIFLMFVPLSPMMGFKPQTSVAGSDPSDQGATKRNGPPFSTDKEAAQKDDLEKEKK